jgi:membrane-bound lytic murein transglycosylase D
VARTGYVDERFDPEKSTRAYARYMKFIYNQLGDWYLSMAAYDWGAGNVQRAVQKTGYADFWELYKRNNLPGETKNYVPEILAAIIIANNPTQYGFDEITLDPPVLDDTVTLDYSVDLRLVSDLVDAPVEQLVALNPSLLRLTTPPDSSFDLHLPAGSAAKFTQRIAAIPEAKRSIWRYHRVAAEDSLASVAHEYHVSVAELATANQLRENASIAGVEALVVPVSPAAAPAARTLLYTARKGDTLITIADRFGVSLDQLHRWNKIAGNKIEPGQRLHVTEPAHLASASVSHRRGSASKAGAKTGTKESAKARGPAPTKAAAASSATKSAPQKSKNTSAKKPGTQTKYSTHEQKKTQ